jgi:carbamoylphosphate synthase large subunit
MTDPEFADRTYVEPITPEFVEKVIEKERPDALLATLGGQTALNAAMALDKAGVLDRYGVELIGASIDAIERGENRESFKKIVEELGGEVARSVIAHSMDDCLAAAEELGYPMVSGRRSRWWHGVRRTTTRRTCAGSPVRDCRRAPPPRCSWRSRSSAGRSTSSR